MISTTALGAACAIGAAITFSLHSVVVHKAFQHASPEAAAVFTNIVGTTIFSSVAVGMWLNGSLPPISGKALLFFGLSGLMINVLGRSFGLWAVRLLGPSRDAASRLMDPAVAYVFSLLFLQETILTAAVVGMLLTLSAVYFLILDVRADDKPVLEGTGKYVGVAVAAGAVLSHTTGHSLRKYAAPLLPSALLGNLVGYMVTNLVYLVTAIVSPKVRASMNRFDRTRMWPLVLCGLLNAASNFLIFEAVILVPVPVAVTLRHTAPWWTMAFGWLFLPGERVVSWRLVGSALLGLTGVWLIASAA